MKCEKLEVWKISARLSAEVYKGLSQCKDFGFRDQITRSCLSIPRIIEAYPEDKPYSSYLIYGQDEVDVLHVVVAYDENCGTVFIITVYRPELKYFESDLKTRRKK